MKMGEGGAETLEGRQERPWWRWLAEGRPANESKKKAGEVILGALRKEG